MAAMTILKEYSIHFSVALSSALFFYMCYRLLLRVIDVAEKDRVNAANTATSLVHSAITGVWSCVSTIGVLQNGDYMDSSWNAELLMAFIIGFFIFDIAVLYANHKQMKLAFAFILHHLCATATYGGCTWFKIGTHYCIMSVASEISNVFLHIRKLMHYQDNNRTNIFYLVNSLVAFFTSFVTRILGFFYIDYRITFVEPVIPGYMWEIVAFGNVVIFCFTVIIFRALLKDFIPKVQRSKNGSALLIASSKDE